MWRVGFAAARRTRSLPGRAPVRVNATIRRPVAAHLPQRLLHPPVAGGLLHTCTASTGVDNRSCWIVTRLVQTRDPAGVRKQPCRAFLGQMASRTAAWWQASGAPRWCGVTNDRSARKSLSTVQVAPDGAPVLLTTGGAYSHLGCRFDCPRGHRGKPHRREQAPGRGACPGRRKAAAALARVVQPGPGSAARGRHVGRPADATSAPHGARMSLDGTSAPRVLLSLRCRSWTRDPLPLASRRSPPPTSASIRRPGIGRSRTAEGPQAG
jgi:hypothetical protein